MSIMTVSDCLRLAGKKLTNARISTYQLDGEILLAHTVKCERSLLFAHPEMALNALQHKRFQSLLQKRSHRIPIAYLVGHKEFFNLDFDVGPSVLIPRPDTEILVDCLNNYLSHNAEKVTVLDIGTGSGCIAISLAHSHPSIRVFGTDSSLRALSIARRNCKKYGFLKRIFLSKANLYPGFPKRFDCIVSNPPYLSSKEYTTALKNYPELRFEPKGALIAKENGLTVLHRIIQICALHLSPNGALFLEIGSGQRHSIQEMVKKYLPHSTLAFHKDLAGRTRVADIRIK